MICIDRARGKGCIGCSVCNPLPRHKEIRRKIENYAIEWNNRENQELILQAKEFRQGTGSYTPSQCSNRDRGFP